MAENEKTQKGDFIELKYTGKANGEIFDSNIEEDLKKINSKVKPQKAIIIIGQHMVVPGLDKALEDKFLNTEYEVSFSYKDGFGERNRNLIRTIPLKAFTEHKLNPQAGMVLTLDNALVKILAVSGARVTADFNNPLAGKNLEYKFTITRIVADEKEKIESFFSFFLLFIPEFEIKDKTVLVKASKPLEIMINSLKNKFSELLKKDLEFEELKEKPREIKEERAHKHSHDGHEHAHTHQHSERPYEHVH